MQTQIRLGLHCLPFLLHLLDTLFDGSATSFKFESGYRLIANVLGIPFFSLSGFYGSYCALQMAEGTYTVISLVCNSGLVIMYVCKASNTSFEI